MLFALDPTNLVAQSSATSMNPTHVLVPTTRVLTIKRKINALIASVPRVYDTLKFLAALSLQVCGLKLHIYCVGMRFPIMFLVVANFHSFVSNAVHSDGTIRLTQLYCPE